MTEIKLLKQELLGQMEIFAKSLFRPVSTGARVKAVLLQKRRPCRVVMRVKAAVTRRDEVMAQVRDGGEVQRAWNDVFKNGHVMQMSPRRIRMENEEIVFECNLLTLEVVDG